MYPTQELRWFFKQDVVFIRKWFEQNHQMYFSKTALRNDYYLPQPGKKNMGIKLREGNIEVKTLHSREKTKIGKISAGYLEGWTKWSFKIDTSDELVKKIVDQHKFGWLKTTKTRMGFKMIETRKGIEVRNIKEEHENGCQVEYTRLKIKKDTWYTFAVEKFGNADPNLYEPFLKEIASFVSLPAKNSMGYPQLLNKYYF